MYCLFRLVRDYLELEFQAVAAPFPLDMERVVDDFVLFCMLIGNDFLPCARPPFLLMMPVSAPWLHAEANALMRTCTSQERWALVD